MKKLGSLHRFGSRRTDMWRSGLGGTQQAAKAMKNVVGGEENLRHGRPPRAGATRYLV